ncbi:phytoene desaturase family protein [Tumebacillus flagellatus]|uniref:Amine oxidase domain-containing protein n=1 Tax=Tumebacillus flagellatus TaxID=1157490 RepID=A0A074LXN3_9BACL|nr:phytoene desaturase family protein [Tumebacillus flagellatus]KEO85185.1 hypothetical protein EL26_01100 [Tumebacillus flagellatus]
MKRAIIVGAGVGGLTTGIRLLRQGFDVTILEKNARPGGRLGRISQNGFTFDIGPTILLMPDVFYELFQEVGRNFDDYVEMAQLEPNYRLHYADGSVLASTPNLQRMLTEIQRLAPDDAAGYMKYLHDMYKRYQIARYDFIEQPMLSPLELLKPSKLKKLYQLHTLGNMYDDIKRYVQDERLRMALTFQSLYIGIGPFRAPSIYNVIGFMELSYSGVWYPKGGYYAVAEALVKVFREMGGSLLTQTEVDEVLVEAGQATGVRLVDGREIRGDKVVVNADFPQAMQRMLPKEARGKYTDRKLQRMEQSCSTFMLYLGLNRQYDHVDVHNVFFSGDFQQNVEEIFEQNVMPTDPSLYVHTPSLIDDSVAPPGKSTLYVLVPVPNLSSGIDWAQEKEPFTQRILQKLEQAGFDGLRDAIEFQAVFTPESWKSSFHLQEGAAFGVAPTLTQSAYWRPSLKSKEVKNLYFVGASTHPGGGVPIVMTAARILEGIMAEDDPQAFPVTLPSFRGLVPQQAPFAFREQAAPASEKNQQMNQ